MTLVMLRRTTWKFKNSLVIRDLSEISQSSGLDPCSASVFSVLFLDSLLVLCDSVPHLYSKCFFPFFVS